MAKHSRKFSLRPVKVQPQLVLGTLANNIVVVAGVTGAADGQYRATSISTLWGMSGATAGEGPIIVGYAHSDYTVTEIKEALESNASISIGLKVEQERANRLVRVVGTFANDGTEESLNDGKFIKTKLNWAMSIGKFINIFAYNDSGATLTTGQVVKTQGKLWVKDY